MSDQNDRFDALVVGARPAGAATAMLLARAGWRVLVVDRGRYGTDTLSTHALLRGGVLQLQRWGLLDRIVAAGTPAIRRVTYHYDGMTLPITLKPVHGVDALYAPRRTVLDPTLVDAACDAGATFRYGVTVNDVTRDGDGRVVGVVGRESSGHAFGAHAGIVIGADGLRSVVADRVGAPIERSGRHAAAFMYGYFAAVPLDGYEFVFRPGALAGVIPTNDGMVCVFVGTTPDDLRRGGRARFATMLRAATPDIAHLVLSVRPVGPLRTFRGPASVMKQAAGPGWALVSDAGFWKDPISAHGITDALRDAELLAGALVEQTSEEGARRRYRSQRDPLAAALLDVTDALAGQQWSEREVGSILRTLSALTNEEVALLAALDAPPDQPATESTDLQLQPT